MLIELPVSAGGGLAELIGGALSFGLGIIGSILGSLFAGLFGGDPTKRLADALNMLARSVAQSLDLLKRFAWTIARAFGSLLATLQAWFVDFLQFVWAMLKDIAGMISKLVKDILPAIARVVRAARDALGKFYQDYLRPVLNWIQRARRYLAILRALHVPYADKIDQILVRIEGRLIGPFLYVLRTLNGIGSWVNVVLTAGGVIQRPLFDRTIFQYQDDWINLWWVAQAANSGAAPVRSTTGTAAPPTDPQVKANWDVYARTGAGPMADVLQQSFQYGDQAQAA